MRTSGLITFLVLAVSGVSVAKESDIVQIRAEYQAIRAELSNLKVDTVTLDGISTEGADAKAYRDGKGNVRLIRAELFFESGKEIGEYYYKDGKLIFCFYTTHRYNAPKKIRVSEDRYYFKDGKLIRWLGEAKKDVDPNSKEYKDAEEGLLKFSNELLSKFKRKT